MRRWLIVIAGCASSRPAGAPTAATPTRPEAVVVAGDPCEGGEIAGEGGLGVSNTSQASATGARYNLTRGSSNVTGSLDKDAIKRVVRAHMNEVRACYEKALQADDNAAGAVHVRFTIGASGAITEASATGVSTALDDCIAAAVKTWAFPAPTGGGPVVVDYPFNFSR